MFHYTPLTCACRAPICMVASYNLYLRRIHPFHVRSADNRRPVSILFEGASQFELLMALNGSLLPNKYVKLCNSTEIIPQTVSIRFTENTQSPLALPVWELANS